MFFNSNIEKMIVWMPTYRNHKSDKNNIEAQTNINFKFGVPIINDIEQLEQVNQLLKLNKVLLLIKLHPVENISKISKCQFSNIKVINDNSIFEEKHLNIYNLLSVSDALITDYSSIYYDYLLMDKPIGLAIPDIKEYSKNIKFNFDNYEENIIGEYIYNFDDLLKFINNIINNKDVTYEKRIEKKKIYHDYFDDNSSKRVLKILTDKMKEEEN
jgi:CDP-glycerol glycerophosphotransferase (TagB/SpsB family)